MLNKKRIHNQILQTSPHCDVSMSEHLHHHNILIGLEILVYRTNCKNKTKTKQGYPIRYCKPTPFETLIVNFRVFKVNVESDINLIMMGI